MKNVIVTGACGFIGTHLTSILSSKGINVYAICRPNSKNISRICDLPNVKVIESMFVKKPIDVIFHLAWDNPSGKLRADFSTQLRNVNYATEIAELARKCECSKVVATGTIFENLCWQISQIPQFTNSAYYLYTKKYIYEMLRQLSLQSGFQLTWLTFCHPIGKYNKPEQLIAGSILKLLNKQPVLLGHGNNIFDIIAVEDLANALYLAGNIKLNSDRYFIGSERPCSVREYLERVRNIVNPNGELCFGEIPADGLDLLPKWLDYSAFAEETGYSPKICFDTAVRATAEWLFNFKKEEL
ncbi:MAG: NAD(P)-dependent oxidoreductase [Fibromonadaceae bacterium]|jgi:nucleoside-diphosphate-sugar epimerase|nr:NAD(P)-dependent oxidoreductase [Fibromonadaceae bacterium]